MFILRGGGKAKRGTDGLTEIAVIGTPFTLCAFGKLTDQIHVQYFVFWLVGKRVIEALYQREQMR